MQIMGPGDSYLIQYSKDVGRFWADKHSLALGARFRAPDGRALQRAPQSILPQVIFLLSEGHKGTCSDLLGSFAAVCKFNSSSSSSSLSNQTSVAHQDAFDRFVEQGYQASQTWHQGEITCMVLSLHRFAVPCRSSIQLLSRASRRRLHAQEAWLQMGRAHKATSNPLCHQQNGPFR